VGGWVGMEISDCGGGVGEGTLEERPAPGGMMTSLMPLFVYFGLLSKGE
jgi:hypothetical protein